MSETETRAVVVAEPVRLPMPTGVADRYKIDEEGWRVLVNATFPLAKTSAGVVMALAYCERRGLDPFRKSVHLVPMKVTTQEGEKEIETIWPGIGELRITAQRQADFFGYDECEFGPDIPFKGLARVQKWTQGRRDGWEEVKWEGVVPEWAQFTVYKLIHGQRVALKGPRVFFIETYSPVSRFNAAPNERWTRAPRQMLEKNAEAASLRRAWPDVFGDEATFEEMEGKHLYQGGGSSDTPPADPVATDAPDTKPKRSDFADKAAADVVDAEFTPCEEGNAPAAEATVEEGPVLPQTPAQWEVWKDNVLDAILDRETADQLERLRSVQQQRIDAAPPEIQKIVLKAFENPGF